MRDGAQSGQDFFEIRERQRQRIAAGDDHVADLGMFGHVLDHRFDAALAGRPILIHPLPFARAVAAVERAIRSYEKEAAIGISVNDSGHRRIALFIQRIPCQLAGIEQLLDRRN